MVLCYLTFYCWWWILFLLDLLTAIFNFTFSYLGMITSKLFQSLFLNCCLVLVEHLRSHGACWSSGKPIGGYPKEVSMILTTEGSCYREEKSYSHKAGGGWSRAAWSSCMGILHRRRPVRQADNFNTVCPTWEVFREP